MLTKTLIIAVSLFYTGVFTQTTTIAAFGDPQKIDSGTDKTQDVIPLYERAASWSPDAT